MIHCTDGLTNAASPTDSHPSPDSYKSKADPNRSSVYDTQA